jgi:anti-repressor protein
MSSIIRYQFGSNTIHTIIHADEPWFVFNDLRSAVGIEEGLSITDCLDDHEKTVARVEAPGGCQHIVVVNLSGLHSVIAASKHAVAKQFKRWIAAEVLPSILGILPPKCCPPW